MSAVMIETNQNLSYEQDSYDVANLISQVLESDADGSEHTAEVTHWLTSAIKHHVLSGESVDRLLGLKQSYGKQPRIIYLKSELNTALRNAADILAMEPWSASIRISNDIHSGFMTGSESSCDPYWQAIHVSVQLCDRLNASYQPQSIYARIR